MSPQSDQGLCFTYRALVAEEYIDKQQKPWLSSCATQLSMKFVLLINLILLTIANSFLLNIVEHENFSAIKYESSAQLSMKMSLLLNMKMQTIVGIFIFNSREILMLR